MLTGTGTANTINGEVGLTYDGLTLTVSGSTVITGSLLVSASGGNPIALTVDGNISTNGDINTGTINAAAVDTTNLTVDGLAIFNAGLRVNTQPFIVTGSTILSGSTQITGSLQVLGPVSASIFSGSLDRFNPPALKITVGTTAPSSPAINDLWVDTN